VKSTFHVPQKSFARKKNEKKEKDLKGIYGLIKNSF
jgi:hypothetical protein